MKKGRIFLRPTTGICKALEKNAFKYVPVGVAFLRVVFSGVLEILQISWWTAA
jgi:hypothetical protein